MSKNSFVDKTCKIAKGIVSKTHKIFEVSQLNLKIVQIKNKIERKYVKIGYCIYNKQKEEGFGKLHDIVNNEKFKLICKDIDELYSKLKAVEEELDEIRRYDKNKKNFDCNCCEPVEKSNLFESE